MSKKTFVPQRETIEHAKPVRVAVKAANAIPVREPRSWWVLIGMPALLIGLLGTVVMLYVSGARNVGTGILPMVGIIGMGMLMFSGRFGGARKISYGEQENGRRTYLRDLDVDRDQIQTAVCAERKTQLRVHSSPERLGAVIGGTQMWERRRTDPDFLDVRLGVGVQNAPDSVLSVEWPDIPFDEELEPVSGMALRDFILEQRKIRDIAKILNLRSQPGFSFVGKELDQVRSLVRAILCAVAVFHSPRDVKILVVSRNPGLWEWLAWLPHNLHDELFDACGWRRLVFTNPAELEQTLISDLKREFWTRPAGDTPSTTPSTLESDAAQQESNSIPHWIIVDDDTGTPEAWEGVVGKVGKQAMTILRVASRPGVGVGFQPGQINDLQERPGRADPLVFADGKFFAIADQLSIPRAARYARAMARWTPVNQDAATDATSGSAGLMRALAIADPRVLDVKRLWAERRSRADERWAEIPVGAKPNGELQNISIRAKEFGGMGFHSFVIGTSGSGKSEYFLSLTYGAALTHSPSALNIIFVDMKYDSAAQDIVGIPHVPAALSNLTNDKRHLAERMRKALRGEIARRYRMQAAVGARDANDYEEIRLAGRDLEPIPVLLVIIDEYLELFNLHPDWIELIVFIAQQGRGANVFFTLGGQRLDLSSLQKVKSNIGFRVALRAETPDDSRDVLGNTDAFNLPAKDNGYAVLKVGPSQDVFRCFYLSAHYVLPKQVQQSSGHKAIDMTLTEPRLFGWEHQALPESDAAALEAAAQAEAEPDEYLYHDEAKTKKLKLVDVLRSSLMAVPDRVPHNPWLPPLEVPEQVDELVQRYRGKPWHEDYGNNDGLVFPFAVVDIPEDAAQLVHSVDALRANIMVVGAKQRGKSTTLMTVICSAALMYRPERLSFFCIGGAEVAKLRSVPHVVDSVSLLDLEGVARTIATLEALTVSREERFRREAIDIDEYRARRFGVGGELGGADAGDDRYGDVFLVVDDFNRLMEADQALGERVINLSGNGLAYGVHVMFSASGYFHGNKSMLKQNMNVKIQLRLANHNENEMGAADQMREARKAAERTLDRPGFGLTPDAQEMLVGMPTVTDGAGAACGAAELGALIADVAGVDKHATLMRLPQRIALGQILASPAAHEAPQPSISFAISEQRDLAAAPLSLTAHPGLVIVGRQGCGKSTALAAIGEAVMARFSPEQVRLTIIDPNTGPLTNLMSDEYVENYAYDQDHINEVLTRLATEVLAPRLPATGLSQAELRELKGWQGPRHVVLIDDAQDLRRGGGFPATQPVGAPLWKMMERARDIGLHVFLAHTVGPNWMMLETDPWIKPQTMAKVPRLYMDNDPANYIVQSARVRAQALPPGRGLLVTGESEVEAVLVGTPTISADALG